MQTKMKISKKSILIILMLILAVIIASICAISIYYGSYFPFSERQRPPQDYILGDLEFFYFAQAILSTMNVVLLIILILNYVGIYLKTRSTFTVGLLIFAGALLLKDLFSNSMLIGIFGFRGFGLGPFVLIPDIFEFAALTALLYLSVKY